MAAVAAVLGGWALVTLWPRATGPEAPVRTSQTQLTAMPGAEQHPSLSPDGGWFVYAGQGAGNYDIYLQRIGGRSPINLTEDSPADDKHPAYSPDGRWIAFRSEREGGGLFVMEPTGEASRRLTRDGFNPAWSPDGERLVFSGEAVELNPLNWGAAGGLWVVELASREVRQLFAEDAVQPAWSPDGRRIAYTARRREPAQMDIWTIAADGSDARQVTRDEATDWSPAWAPDGRSIYFASDRSGSMNLWRVAVDPDSGEARGEPHPITTPATFLSHLSVSADGRAVAYGSAVTTQNVQVLELGADRKVADEPEWLTRGSILFSSPDASPDGEWVTFYTRVQPEGDLYVVRVDGSGLREVTGGDWHDRMPRWSSDGEWIGFFSNRSGQLEIWKVRPDGSDLTQMTSRGGSLIAWSPVGDRLAVSSLSAGETYFIPSAGSAEGQEVTLLPDPGGVADSFVVTAWSSDGGFLAGTDGYPGKGVVVYSLESGTYQKVTDFGEWPAWLPDNRHLLFVSEGRHFHVVDRTTGAIERIFTVTHDVIGPPRPSANGRRVYYSRRVTEADIWLLTLEELEE